MLLGQCHGQVCLFRPAGLPWSAWEKKASGFVLSGAVPVASLLISSLLPFILRLCWGPVLLALNLALDPLLRTGLAWLWHLHGCHLGSQLSGDAHTQLACSSESMDSFKREKTSHSADLPLPGIWGRRSKESPFQSAAGGQTPVPGQSPLPSTHACLLSSAPPPSSSLHTLSETLRPAAQSSPPNTSQVRVM